MSKNSHSVKMGKGGIGYLGSLVLAVAFLFAANGQADIITSMDSIDSDNVLFSFKVKRDGGANGALEFSEQSPENAITWGSNEFTIDSGYTILGFSIDRAPNPNGQPRPGILSTMGSAWTAETSDGEQFDFYAGWDGREQFSPIFFTFGPVSSDTLTFSFDPTQGTNGTFTFTFYGVRGTTATPEPATLALMGLGLAGLGLARARRRK